MSEQDTPVDLAALVPAWLDWAETANALGASVNQVKTMIRDHQLAAAVPVPGEGSKVPAELIMDGVIVKGVSGLLVLLHDNRYDDRQAIAWIFTEMPDLPGRPIDALRENRGAEVKRRAQVLAF